MQIEVRPRKIVYTPVLQERVKRHFGKIGKRVSLPAVLHLNLSEEVNHSDKFCAVAEADLHLKGAVLHAEGHEEDMGVAIEKAAEMLAKQVDKYIGKNQH